MSNPRCDRCKFWGTSDYAAWDAEHIGFKECTAVRERWVIADEASEASARWRECSDMDAVKAKRLSALQSARAYVEDGSEYRATLVTGPDFFCALFEGAEKP